MISSTATLHKWYLHIRQPGNRSEQPKKKKKKHERRHHSDHDYDHDDHDKNADRKPRTATANEHNSEHNNFNKYDGTTAVSSLVTPHRLTWAVSSNSLLRSSSLFSWIMAIVLLRAISSTTLMVYGDPMYFSSSAAICPASVCHFTVIFCSIHNNAG